MRAGQERAAGVCREDRLALRVYAGLIFLPTINIPRNENRSVTMDPETNQTATTSEEPNRRKRNVRFKLLAIAIGILIGLAATEIGLRLVERVRLGNRAAGATMPDSKLGTRMVPNTGGQDANGFRNATVRSHVDVVALADFQT